MVSEYMLIYFIHKYVSDNQIDLESMWKEINGLQTKVEYIAVSNDYYEISVGDEVGEEVQFVFMELIVCGEWIGR